MLVLICATVLIRGVELGFERKDAADPIWLRFKAISKLFLEAKTVVELVIFTWAMVLQIDKKSLLSFSFVIVLSMRFFFLGVGGCCLCREGCTTGRLAAV